VHYEVCFFEFLTTTLIYRHTDSLGWLGGGLCVRLVIDRSRVRLPASTPSGNNSWQVVNTHMLTLCHQAVQFGTGQRTVMLCDREGNRSSGHASQTLVVYPRVGSTATEREMSTPLTLHTGAWSTLHM